MTLLIVLQRKNNHNSNLLDGYALEEAVMYPTTAIL